MQRQLMILEVSQKQAYIFAPRQLRENRKRSEQIAFVTSEACFLELCQNGEYTPNNMVYSGGGHTVLQFDSEASATAFAKVVSEQVLRRYPQMELFIKQLPYDNSKTPGENLNLLSEALETKKALRRASFRTHAMGIEKHVAVPEQSSGSAPELFHGWKLTSDAKKIANDDNFLAVVHLDGNAMGTRVQAIYDACQNDWDACVEKLQLFSQQIDTHFDEAFNDMALELIGQLDADQTGRWANRVLPLRRLIGAGDDVCFITTGYLGLECAASFLRHLGSKTNLADGKSYSACAGVVLIHEKFPFRQAYDLSEALCSNAKLFVAENGGGFSAMDYHIEFGQMKPSLSHIRQDYRTEDGGHLELRPVAIDGNVPPERRYDFLTALIAEMKDNHAGLARSKVKALRSAFHQGEMESALALRMTGTESLLYRGLEKRYPDWLHQTVSGTMLERGAFFTDRQGERRCLYFDAIELMDHTLLWKHSPKEDGQ